jgi:large subunit ribosomal protein L10
MPAQSKIDMLEKVNKSLETSKGVFVVDYRGLSVKEAQEVRRSLREAGAEMKVYKNTIVKIALENAGMPSIDEKLAGTCAYVFYEKDPVSAAKVIKDQSAKLKKMAFVGGIADGRVISAADAMAYADLPSREELVAKLVYVLGSPLSGVAQVCAGPARGLATVLQAIADQKNAA